MTIILRPLELSLGRERDGSAWEDQRRRRKAGEAAALWPEVESRYTGSVWV